MFKSKMTELLSNVEVFKGLTRDDLKMISKNCKKVVFEEGEVLIQMGERPAALYILIKGRLKVVLPQQLQGRKEHRVSEVKLNVLKQGDCFGEYSLIENRAASASVIGDLPGEVLKVGEAGFKAVMENDRIGRTVYRNLLHILIRRLRKKEEELDLVLVAG